MNLHSIFLKVLNMSLTASVVIAFVLLARIAMRKLPKIYSYVLWSVVLFRLLCPISISSDMSLLGFLEAPTISSGSITSTVEYVPSDVTEAEYSENNISLNYIEESNANKIIQTLEKTSVGPEHILTIIIPYIWVFGIVLMLGYSVYSYFKLQNKLIGAVYVRDNIYMADHISSPFVMGILRPRIYLLSSSNEREQKYIILHEQQHIRRLDHVVKAFAYLALCVHWFNPFVWIAFILSGKDMEMSCDEAVISKMGEEIRADYSTSLLNFTVGQRIVFGTPLAFGEGDTKTRIKNLARWKKPAVWISIVAIVICVLIVWMGIANPEQKQVQSEEIFGHNYQVEEVVSYSVVSSSLYSVETAPQYTLSEDYQLGILEDKESGNWIHAGGFQEIVLTEDNFDSYFDLLSVSAEWNDSEDLSTYLRKNNQKAWNLVVSEDMESSVCYYLLLQENSDLYLLQGVSILENTEEFTTEDSYFNCVYKIRRTDHVSCTAYSKDMEAYVEPTFYPNGFDYEYENVAVGEIRGSGELVFSVDWETDVLTVSEDYYEHRGGSVHISKETYELQKNEDGKYVLNVSRRNNIEDEEAFYFLAGENGTYVVKIEFPVTKDTTVLETFEKRNVNDSYDEWVQHTYYKMSDGTWRVDVVNEENGIVETSSYKYRLVFHGRMPNAAVDSNFILLSNRTDITFRQVYMASGFSSNMDDYFSREEAVFVSSWLGELETNHPQRDKDTVYIIESENDWGIELNVSHLTASGLTIECTQSGGNPSGELQTGSYYVVERKTDEGWESVDYLIENVGWTEEAWTIPKEETVKWEVDWEWLYGKLPEGHYRIGKEIMDFRGTGDYDIVLLYAEFTLE